jgi:hypothetical protein
MATVESELTYEKILKLFEETNRRFEETSRRFEETDRQVKETSREVKEICKRVDGLSSKWGRFVEGLLVPAVERLFKERGITVEKVSQRIKIHKNGDAMEIDIMVINREYVVLIEAKSTLSVENVNEHLEKLARFKSFFPEYADRKVIGAVAGIVIDEGADRYAYKSGLFVIGQSGETVKILNDKKFIPRSW